MPNKKHETDGVPERLRQITIETLPVETPCELDIESFVEPQEVVYIDKTQAGGMGRLAVDARQPVKPLEVVELSDDETVIFTMERKKLILRTKRRRGKSLIVDNIK